MQKCDFVLCNVTVFHDDVSLSKTKPNLSLYSPCYAEVCNEFAVPISESQHQDSTATCVDVEVVANRLQHSEDLLLPHTRLAR